MRDVGFTPRRASSVLGEMLSVLRASLDHGFRKPPVRWSRRDEVGVGLTGPSVPMYPSIRMKGFNGRRGAAGEAQTRLSPFFVLANAVLGESERFPIELRSRAARPQLGGASDAPPRPPTAALEKGET